MEAEGNNIKVCVRVRPFNKREEDMKSPCCVDMPTKTVVTIPDDRGKPKDFTFDRAYWSHDKSTGDFATQETLMEDLGIMLQNNTLAGFNSCLFAYGQTGSGKTHSVLGLPDPPEMRGLLPRIVESIFGEIEADKKSANPSEFQCVVTYLEIYNEAIADLLVPIADRKGKLDVHMHPQLGVVIPGLVETPVRTYDEVQALIDFGSKTRTVAATSMNATSSRSHCSFGFELEKKTVVNGTVSNLRAKLNLVDLAGSERQKKTAAEGKTLKEGAAINVSLSNLALVIKSLAEASSQKKDAKNPVFVPFRTSKLTFILQTSLSGNSKTVMVAAISPAVDNVEETLSTLRFAASVKMIKTDAKKNEQSKETILNELKGEIEKLKAQLRDGGGGNSDPDALSGMEHLYKKFGQDFEKQLEEKKAADERRKQALEEMGLSGDWMASALGMSKSTPQLHNINEDPSLSGCLVYFLVMKEYTTIGCSKDCKIKLTGLGMEDKMLTIHNEDDVTLKITVGEGRVLINAKKPNEARELQHFDRIVLGHAFVLRVTIPNKAAESAHTGFQADEALLDIMSEDREEFQQLSFYFQELQTRVGQTKAQVFMNEFRSVVALVDEVNMISKVIRPNENLIFSIEVMSDVFTYMNDEPECIIRLSQRFTGKQRLYAAMYSHFGNDGIPATMASKLERSSKRAQRMKGSTSLAVWDVPSFKIRMNHFREIYELYINGETVDFRKPEHNPFVQLLPMDVADILQHQDFNLMELQAQNNVASLEPGSISSKYFELEQELDEDRVKWEDQLEAEKAKVEVELKRKAIEIRQLEEELRTIRGVGEKTVAFQLPDDSTFDTRISAAQEEICEVGNMAKNMVHNLEKLKRQVILDTTGVELPEIQESLDCMKIPNRQIENESGEASSDAESSEEDSAEG